VFEMFVYTSMSSVESVVEIYLLATYAQVILGWVSSVLHMCFSLLFGFLSA